VASWITPKARKGIESGIAGRGLFATEPIGHDWRRSDLQERYRGYFSWYLQRKIDSGDQPTSAPRRQQTQNRIDTP
jgi:hypothetical protein